MTGWDLLGRVVRVVLTAIGALTVAAIAAGEWTIRRGQR